MSPPGSEQPAAVRRPDRIVSSQDARQGEDHAEAASIVHPKPHPQELHAVPRPEAPDVQAIPAAIGDAGHVDASLPLAQRLDRLEKQNRWMRSTMVGLLILSGVLSYTAFGSNAVLVKQSVFESQELKMVDGAGNPRLLLRMYSESPVLQLLDAEGKTRLSMGMRFDDSPFVELSDRQGQTRATFEMTDEDKPTVRLFDEQGAPNFVVN